MSGEAGLGDSGSREGPPVQIERIDHLVLTVRDIAATCDFYSRVLGMQVVIFDGNRTAI